jgi:hypothetical protein
LPVLEFHIYIFFFSFSFPFPYLFIYYGTWVQTQGFVLYHLSDACKPFFPLVIFEIGPPFLPDWSECDPPVVRFLPLLGCQAQHHHIQLFPWRLGLVNFFACAGLEL